MNQLLNIQRLLKTSFLDFHFLNAECCLAAHNILRALHKATGSLEWDDNLAKNARKWADFLAHYGWYSYSRGRYLGKYGENLYKSWSWTSAGDPSDKCAEAVHSW